MSSRVTAILVIALLISGGATYLVYRVIAAKAGHGAGKPLSKTIEEDADILVFVFGSLGVE